MPTLPSVVALGENSIEKNLQIDTKHPTFLARHLMGHNTREVYSRFAVWGSKAKKNSVIELGPKS